MCRTVDLLIDSLFFFLHSNECLLLPCLSTQDLQNVFPLLLDSLLIQIIEEEFKEETYLMNSCKFPANFLPVAQMDDLCYWQKIWSSQGQQTQASLLNLPVHNKQRIVAPVCPTTTRPLFVCLPPPPELRAGRAAALRREKWVISSSFVSVTSRFITVIWNEWDALGAFFAACATHPGFEQDQVWLTLPLWEK